MQNPLRRFAEGRADLKRISQKISQAVEKGIELTSFTRELIAKEAAIAESEAKYRALASLIECVVDTVPDFIWAKDLERRYLFSNKALRVLFKLKNKDALLGKTEEELVDERSATGFPVDIQDIKIKKTGHTNGIEVYTKQGTCNGVFFAWQVRRAVLKNASGNIIGTVSVAHDITDNYRESV